jgi:hypothetical protein
VTDILENVNIRNKNSVGILLLEISWYIDTRIEFTGLSDGQILETLHEGKNSVGLLLCIAK